MLMASTTADTSFVATAASSLEILIRWATYMIIVIATK